MRPPELPGYTGSLDSSSSALRSFYSVWHRSSSNQPLPPTICQPCTPVSPELPAPPILRPVVTASLTRCELRGIDSLLSQQIPLSFSHQAISRPPAFPDRWSPCLPCLDLVRSLSPAFLPEPHPAMLSPVYLSSWLDRLLAAQPIPFSLAGSCASSCFVEPTTNPYAAMTSHVYPSSCITDSLAGHASFTPRWRRFSLNQTDASPPTTSCASAFRYTNLLLSSPLSSSFTLTTWNISQPTHPFPSLLSRHVISRPIKVMAI